MNFSIVATIGRQTLNGSYVEFEKIFKRYGYSNEEIGHLISRENRYSEQFLMSLGADSIETFDASNYEGASQIWDMNLPVPNDQKEKYSLVIDSGSLEHIFNFPQAIKNCMEMIVEGGHMIGVTPSNNFLGHGFYQFSPELFYRVFSLENGFEIEKMWLFFPRADSPVYEVSDPAKVKSRVSLANSEETFLFYIARRTKVVDVLAKAPQQSDYEHMVWKNGSGTKKKQVLPSFIIPLGLFILKKLKRFKSISSPIGTGNKNFFKKLEP
ncbi:hypothetical protein [Algoriphagus sp. PAP.12]|uniref:hypothetical protein n=1 Tax=Algoriphagus sp. PAP.12 TaxID=2996678 RepID=UPI00227CDF30|nr:hypothetical protein [Algoriphagus sp. PAP.12]